MRPFQTILASIKCGLLLVSTAHAVVVIGDPNHNTADAFSFGSPYVAVVDIWADSRSGTGILINPSHVLTAKHVAPPNTNNIFVDFNDANNNRIDFQPSGGATWIRGNVVYSALNGSGGDLDGTDLVILKLQTPVTTIAPMRLLGNMSYAVGKEAVMVGFGNYGVGDGTGLSGTASRYAGTNVIDHYGAAATPTGFFSNTENIFSVDFDDGTAGNNKLDQLGSSATPLDKESTTAGGDSGGPLLVEYEGEYLVAGIVSGGLDPNSEYGDIGWWTGVGPYQSVIESYGGVFVAVPEPSVLAFTLISSALVLAFRRNRSC